MIDINATLIAQILNFLILVAILRAVAYKPIVRMLKAREDKIAASLDKADADAAEAEKVLQDYHSKLDAAQVKAQEIRDKAAKLAQEERDASLQETQHEIEQRRKAAEAEIARERAMAVEQLKGEMVTLSMAAASKIIAKNMDAQENEKLIDEFIGQLEKEKIGDLSC